MKNYIQEGRMITVAAPTGGVTSGDIQTSTTAFAGGIDALGQGRNGVGTFVRTDIVPYAATSVPATYPKYPGRTDCAGTVCTYAEEMTNFAN